MRLLLRRVLQGAGAAGLVVALSSGPVSAGVGTRLANGDGDTANKCMSIVNAGRGTSVEMEPCTTNAHQGWELDYVGDNLFRIVSQDTADARGRCLTAHSEGVRVTMDRCADPDTGIGQRQSWSRWRVSPGWYLYESWWQFPGPADRQCLDVRGSGTTNVVQIWQCGPVAGPDIKGNQIWKFW